MKVILNTKERETDVDMIKEKNCYHQYLKLNPITKEKMCVSCGKTIYTGSK